LNLSKRFKPVLICRCVSLHRTLQGAKCAAQAITVVPLLGWPENEVTTSSRDAEMDTAGSTSAVNFKQLC